MVALAVALAAGSCAGDRGRDGPPATTPGGPPATSDTPPATTGTTAGSPAVTPSRPVPRAGSVAFTVLGAPLSEGGLRVLMGPSEGAVEVVVGGSPAASNEVEVCPVAGVGGVPDEARCVVATPGRTVALVVGGGSSQGPDGGLTGVLLRPRNGSPATGSRVPEVTFTYRPSGAAITVVTPALPPAGAPGECPGGACEMSLDLTPTGSGTFELEADGRGGRPQLTLRSGPGSPGQPPSASRVVSIVEGGGRLRIRSTVQGPSGVSLTLRNLGDVHLVPLELALVWPPGP
jgi:hypothetical protein